VSIKINKKSEFLYQTALDAFRE